MGIKRTTTTPPPVHPKTKRSLTRHEVTSYQFPLSADENAELADEMEENTVEAFLSRTEEWARDTLTAAGLPGHLGAVRRDADGRWFDDLPKGWRQRKPADVLKPGETVATVSRLVEDRPHHSPEWLAARVLRFAVRTRYHTELGNSRDAVWSAIHLVQAISLTNFKMDFERLLSVGIKVIESAHESGKETRSDRQKRDERWCSGAQQIRERHPGWSHERIIQQILKNESQRDNGKSWSRSTVYRAIIKLFKPRD